MKNWIGMMIVTLLAPLALVWLRRRAVEVPNVVLNYLVKQWNTYLGQSLDEPTKRLFAKWAHSSFQWAEEEMPDKIGAERMDEVIVKLKSLPIIGLIVEKQEEAVRALLEIEFQSWKLKVESESKD